MRQKAPGLVANIVKLKLLIQAHIKGEPVSMTEELGPQKPLDRVFSLDSVTCRGLFLAGS